MKLLVMSPIGATLVDGPTLVAAAVEQFGAKARAQPSPPGWETDVSIHVTLERDSLGLFHFADNRLGSFESGSLPLREAVAWYRSLLPADFPRLIACDQGWNGHVDLHHGITAQEIADRWVDHAVEGWDAGDPDLG
ncbi:hypothetical protein [Actinotalea subterranea]|uniref:hypothetical protein n=1 Tax=Actinotalea subterranea TaxID=2607497 RepID=UPI0011EC534D|nr:hypothetical protein [Actinotalea subterranea]